MQLEMEVKALKGFVSNVGPYLMVEMLLPGGSLIALGMYLYRRNRDGAGFGALCAGERSAK